MGCSARSGVCACSSACLNPSKSACLRSSWGGVETLIGLVESVSITGCDIVCGYMVV